MGITIVGINEQDGTKILNLLNELVEVEKQILERVKRLKGRPKRLQFILGKPQAQ